MTPSPHRVVGLPHRVVGAPHRVLGVPHRVVGVAHRVVGLPPVSAITRRRRSGGFFGDVMTHQNCIPVAQLFLLRRLQVLSASFSGNARFTSFFGGSGHLKQLRARPGPEISDPPKSLIYFLLVAVPKSLIPSKPEAFPSSALGAPYGGRAHLNCFCRFPGLRCTDITKSQLGLPLFLIRGRGHRAEVRST